MFDSNNNNCPGNKAQFKHLKFGFRNMFRNQQHKISMYNMKPKFKPKILNAFTVLVYSDLDLDIVKLEIGCPVDSRCE